MKDVRTPNTYFQKVGAAPESVQKLKAKLDDLLVSLYALKDKRGVGPTAQLIVDNEIEKAEEQRYRKVSRQNAAKVVEAFLSGTQEDAVAAIEEALDYKVFCRIEPHLVETGDDIEHQVFWSDLVGHK